MLSHLPFEIRYWWNTAVTHRRKRHRMSRKQKVRWMNARGIWIHIAERNKRRYTKWDSHLLNFVINEISHFFVALKKQFQLDKLRQQKNGIRLSTEKMAFASRWTVSNNCVNLWQKINGRFGPFIHFTVKFTFFFSIYFSVHSVVKYSTVFFYTFFHFQRAAVVQS